MKIRVAFVCWGNICRSTLSESVFTYKVKEKGLSDQFVIDSFATSTEEIGNPPHRAKQISFSDYDNFDYIVGMDSINIKYLNRMLKGDPDGKISKLLDYTSRKGADIADPWYTGNFDATYRDVNEGCDGLLAYILEQK